MNKSYVIWNNKGGVGKSTITFHIASMYAEKNQDRNVVVIDMCPQANSSMMLMGGGTGAESRLQELIRPLAKKICVIFKGWLKFRSNFELLGYWHLLKLAQPARL